MSYRGLGGTTPSYGSPFSVNAVLDPQPPVTLTGSASGTILATLLALVPAMAFGAWTGASAASYDDKQKEWALYGAAAGGTVAALMLGLNAARKT
jgi:hypothetical protein